MGTDSNIVQNWAHMAAVKVYPNCGSLSRSNTDGGPYAVKDDYLLLNQRLNGVVWFGSVWYKAAVPRYSICAWRFLPNKLATLECCKKKDSA